MSTCLTLSVIRYLPRVKWRNPGKGVVVVVHLAVVAVENGAFRVHFDYDQQLWFFIYIYIYKQNLALTNLQGLIRHKTPSK